MKTSFFIKNTFLRISRRNIRFEINRLPSLVDFCRPNMTHLDLFHWKRSISVKNSWDEEFYQKSCVFLSSKLDLGFICFFQWLKTCWINELLSQLAWFFIKAWVRFRFWLNFKVLNDSQVELEVKKGELRMQAWSHDSCRIRYFLVTVWLKRVRSYRASC